MMDRVWVSRKIKGRSERLAIVRRPNMNEWIYVHPLALGPTTTFIILFLLLLQLFKIKNKIYLFIFIFLSPKSGQTGQTVKDTHSLSPFGFCNRYLSPSPSPSSPPPPSLTKTLFSFFLFLFSFFLFRTNQLSCHFRTTKPSPLLSSVPIINKTKIINNFHITMFSNNIQHLIEWLN